MRKRLIGSMLLVALLIALLVPIVHVLSSGQGAIDANDADHMVKPMLAMLAESPQMKANIAVEPMMELEDVWPLRTSARRAGKSRWLSA